jgi:DNA-directed RNA polymerase beta subunit
VNLAEVIATKQVNPTNVNEPPLICTGAEFIATQLSSRRFVQKANFDGVVEEIVPNKYITIKYKDGSRESFDIIPRLSKTKMNNYVSLEMNTLKVGEKVSKNQPVAWTKNFAANGMYCSGTNVKMAIMNYMGNNHEDAYCVTEQFSERTTRDILKEIQVIIPPEVKILKLQKKTGKMITKNDVLVEFQYPLGLSNYLDDHELLSDMNLEDDENDLTDTTIIKGGENSIKTMGKEGEIVDIKVFLNNKKNIDRQVTLLHKNLVDSTKETISKLEENYKDDNDKIKASDNISSKFFKVGGHKLKGGKEFAGARIVYLIKQKLPLFSGDKIASRYGAKGTIAEHIITKENTPYSNSMGTLDVFCSPTGLFSRKSLAMIKEIYLGKVIYFLDLKIKKMSEDRKVKTNEIMLLLTEIYELLGGQESKKVIENYFKEYTPEKFRSMLKTNKDFKLFFPVTPFKKIEFSSIAEAARLLDIELDEKVYIPELKSWTKNKVPVGMMYIQILEQTSQSYARVRSTAKYQRGTGQATKGAMNVGGQAIGQLDVNAFLSYDAPDVLTELFTLRSDEHQSKQIVFNNIVNNGHSDMPDFIKKGETEGLLDLYLKGLGVITI